MYRIRVNVWYSAMTSSLDMAYSGPSVPSPLNTMTPVTSHTWSLQAGVEGKFSRLPHLQWNNVLVCQILMRAAP